MPSSLRSASAKSTKPEPSIAAFTVPIASVARASPNARAITARLVASPALASPVQAHAATT